MYFSETYPLRGKLDIILDLCSFRYCTVYLGKKGTVYEGLHYTVLVECKYHTVACKTEHTDIKEDSAKVQHSLKLQFNYFGRSPIGLFNLLIAQHIYPLESR